MTLAGEFQHRLLDRLPTVPRILTGRAWDAIVLRVDRGIALTMAVAALILCGARLEFPHPVVYLGLDQTGVRVTGVITSSKRNTNQPRIHDVSYRFEDRAGTTRIGVASIGSSEYPDHVSSDPIQVVYWAGDSSVFHVLNNPDIFRLIGLYAFGACFAARAAGGLVRQYRRRSKMLRLTRIGKGMLGKITALHVIKRSFLGHWLDMTISYPGVGSELALRYAGLARPRAGIETIFGTISLGDLAVEDGFNKKSDPYLQEFDVIAILFNPADPRDAVVYPLELYEFDSGDLWRIDN